MKNRFYCLLSRKAVAFSGFREGFFNGELRMENGRAGFRFSEQGAGK